MILDILVFFVLTTIAILLDWKFTKSLKGFEEAEN